VTENIKITDIGMSISSSSSSESEYDECEGEISGTEELEGDSVLCI
jgi:hypothetical protein